MNSFVISWLHHKSSELNQIIFIEDVSIIIYS